MATNTTATSQNHNGTGSQNNFAISFAFLANTEVDVTVGGVLKTLGTHYNIVGSEVQFTSGNTPPSGTGNVKFTRDTNISTKKVDFKDGSVLTEIDLDTNSDQVLFAQQEITDKLSGIEENATADQTDAEIRTAVGNASDSNIFTDALKSKLDAIEANATQDQTAGEIRTLVESASDSNVFTDADHTKLNNIEANATADQTNAEIKTAYEANSDTNAFTDAEKTKLAGISAGAGATDFTSLTDTPANFSGAGGKTVKVNSSANALEFVDQISDVIGDTTPQLGGDLDVLTREITTSTTNGNIKLNSNGTGAIELFHNNAKKVETTTTGLSVTGNINLPDSTSNTIGRIMLGDGTDMQIQHDGGGGFIGNFTGNLTVHTNALRFMNGSKSENFLVANQNSSVDLYYDNANKFKTASYGVEIRGDGSSANGKIQLNCSQNSHGVKLESPDHSASQSYTIKLPDNQIAADKILKVKSISGSGATAVGQLEFADAGGAGATGGGTDQAFFEGDQTVTTSYTLTANKNAMAISPTIDSGATITVPSGAILVIL